MCWDNDVADNFFATLKTDLVHLRPSPIRTQAPSALFEFIVSFYNCLKLHSALRYLSREDNKRRRTKLHARTREAA